MFNKEQVILFFAFCRRLFAWTGDSEMTLQRAKDCTKEVDQYLSLRRISHDNDPLSWWREKRPQIHLIDYLLQIMGKGLEHGKNKFIL